MGFASIPDSFKQGVQPGGDGKVSIDSHLLLYSKQNIERVAFHDERNYVGDPLLWIVGKNPFKDC